MVVWHSLFQYEVRWSHHNLDRNHQFFHLLYLKQNCTLSSVILATGSRENIRFKEAASLKEKITFQQLQWQKQGQQKTDYLISPPWPVVPCLESWLFSLDWFISLSLPCGSAGKESTRIAGDLGSIPRLGRSPGEGKGYPLQYSGLENSMDSIVCGVTKSQTLLSDFHFHLYHS